MATTTTEMVSSVYAAPAPNSRPKVGRIACVQYTVANIPAAPRPKLDRPNQFELVPWTVSLAFPGRLLADPKKSL